MTPLVRALAAALAVAVLALLGVGAAGAANGEPKRAITKADQARAASVVLRRADLGAGFTSRPNGSDDLPPGVRCGPLSESDLTVTGDAESPDFQLNQPGVLLTIGSTAQVYRTLRDADASWSRSQKPAALTCLSDIVRRSGGPGQRLDVLSATRRPFPKLGLRTTAFRVVARLQSGSTPVKVFFDAILLQQGRIQAGLVFTSAVQPVPQADQAALARVVAARIAKAVRSSGSGLVA